MEEWRRVAACRGLPSELFFPDDENDDNQCLDAKKVCVDCPSIMPCLDFSVRAGEQSGIWGGTGLPPRNQLRRILATGDVMAYQRALGEEMAVLGRQFSGFEDERPEAAASECARCGSLVPAGRHPLDRNGPGATCGFTATYNRGCRCLLCAQAKSDYHADRKRKGAYRRELAKLRKSTGG